MALHFKQFYNKIFYYRRKYNAILLLHFISIYHRRVTHIQRIEILLSPQCQRSDERNITGENLILLHSEDNLLPCGRIS